MVGCDAVAGRQLMAGAFVECHVDCKFSLVLVSQTGFT